MKCVLEFSYIVNVSNNLFKATDHDRLNRKKDFVCYVCQRKGGHKAYEQVTLIE